MTAVDVVSTVTALSPFLIAVTALLLNYRGFTSLERRMERIEDKMERIDGDLKQFNRSLLQVENDVARIKEKLNMAPS